MNREQRRNFEKMGASKKTLNKLADFEKPCTILEVVKLSRAIAEDVATEYLEDYRKRSANTIIALTLQVELLKSILVENGLISEEKFQSLYEASAKEFEEKQRQYFNALQEAESQHLSDEANAAEEESPRPQSNVSFEETIHPIEVTITSEEVDD